MTGLFISAPPSPTFVQPTLSPPRAGRNGLSLCDAPVACDVDALLGEPFPHEELERRPGAAPCIEHPVDLPLREEAVVGLARLGPVGELRQPPQAQRQLGALLDRALEPFLPHRHVEAGLAQRARERAERVPVQRLGRHLPAALVEVARARDAAELLAELAQELQQLLARREPARDEPGLAL